jgi:pimeloyl-ACP methyl ester carboxylesterase
VTRRTSRIARRQQAVATYVVGSPDRGDVVVLPGLCVSSYLRPACAALADAGYRAWLLEPPGWPAARRGAARPDRLGDLATPVTTFLEEQLLGQVVLVGQSVGTQVAAHVAGRRPDLVRHLVLQGPVFDPSCRSTWRALVRWTSDMPRERVTLAAREVPEWLSVGPRRIRHLLRLALADRLEETMTTMSCPATVVVGEHDPLGGRRWAGSLAGPGRLVVMRGLPHSAAHHDTRGFAEILRACT